MRITTEVYNQIALQFVEKGTTNETLFTGFASECGEVMQERMSEVRRATIKDDEIIDELSDVLWYITVIANKRGKTLKQLMKYNINKLELRLLEGK